MKPKNAVPFRYRAVTLVLLWLIGGGTLLYGLPSSSRSQAPPVGAPGTNLGGETTPELRGAVWYDSLEAAPPLRDGDSLWVDTEWNRTDLSMTADLSDLVAEGDTAVALTTAGDGVYRLAFRIPEDNTRSDSPTIFIPFTVGGPDLADTTFNALQVCLSNTNPRVLNRELRPDRDTFRGNDILRLRVSWSGAVSSVDFDLRELDPTLEDVIPGTQVQGSQYEVEYRLPAGIADDTLRVFTTATDMDCGVTTDTLNLIVDSSELFPPVLVDWEVRSPVDSGGTPLPLTDGDTIRLWTQWDRDSLEIAADPFDLAPEDVTRPNIIPRGPGEFEIVYTLPSENAGDGDGRILRLIAEDPRGQFTIDTSVRFCISNLQPEYISSAFIDTPPVLKRGSDVTIESFWRSENGLPLAVSGDLSGLEPARTGLVAAEADTTYEGSDLRFVLEYKVLSTEERAPDGTDIPIRLFAEEIGGCGVAPNPPTLFVSLDTTPPDSLPPILNPLPEQTTADTILVTGFTTPEAFSAGISRQSQRLDLTSPVDSIDGSFSFRLGLLPNLENVIRVFAADSLGNQTRSSDPAFVTQVSSRAILFDSPFERGDEIRVSDPSGMTNLELAIHDLEGARVIEWSDPGPILEQSWIWDGVDADGDDLRQGYYLVRATWKDSQGKSQEKTEGLVLGN